MIPARNATLAPARASEAPGLAVLGVMAGDELYGFPLSVIREILVPPPVAEVPRAPASVLGVISVRGQIITLLDLPRLLELEVKGKSSHGAVLLIDRGEELVGVAVGRVIQVFRMLPERVEYASAMGAELSDYIVGVGRVPAASGAEGEDILILIDPVSLLGG